eukprot:scaffold1861_cov111-Isochrysis_galbana.AAC.3
MTLAPSVPPGQRRPAQQQRQPRRHSTAGALPFVVRRARPANRLRSAARPAGYWMRQDGGTGGTTSPGEATSRCMPRGRCGRMEVG